MPAFTQAVCGPTVSRANGWAVESAECEDDYINPHSFQHRSFHRVPSSDPANAPEDAQSNSTAKVTCLHERPGENAKRIVRVVIVSTRVQQESAKLVAEDKTVGSK